jgi:hypothetical protein
LCMVLLEDYNICSELGNKQKGRRITSAGLKQDR